MPPHNIKRASRENCLRLATKAKKSAEPLTAQKSHDEPVRATAKPPRATSQTKASHHPRIVIGQGLDTESAEDGERWSQPQCCLRYCVAPIYTVGGSVPVTFEARHTSRMMQIGRFSERDVPLTLRHSQFSVYGPSRVLSGPPCVRAGWKSTPLAQKCCFSNICSSAGKTAVTGVVGRIHRF